MPKMKMITHTLKILRHDGLVQRKIYVVAPPRIKYATYGARPERC